MKYVDNDVMEWLKEEGKDVYYPFDRRSGKVIIGMSLITKDPSRLNVIGSFYYDRDGNVNVNLTH